MPTSWPYSNIDNQANNYRKFHFVYLMASSWCRAAQTEQNYYWSLSNTIDKIEPITPRKNMPITTLDMTTIFSCIILVRILLHTQSWRITPPVVFTRVCPFRLSLHIAWRCQDLSRFVVSLKRRGIGSLPDSEKKHWLQMDNTLNYFTLTFDKNPRRLFI